jgi:hypothetical protein
LPIGASRRGRNRHGVPWHRIPQLNTVIPDFRLGLQGGQSLFKAAGAPTNVCNILKERKYLCLLAPFTAAAGSARQWQVFRAIRELRCYIRQL